MANNPYPNLRHESTRISDAYNNAEEKVVAGAASAGLWLGKKAVNGAWGLTKASVPIALRGASLIGSAGYNTASLLGRAAYTSLNSSNPILNPVGTAVKGMYKLGQKMVDYSPGERVYNTTRKKVVNKAPSMKLSRLGVGVVLGASVLSGASAAYDKFMAQRLGTVDTQATTSTPDYTPQEYTRQFEPVDDGGATGDLVFALFKNRRGGSLL